MIFSAKNYKNIDYLLVLLTFALVGLGLAFIYSATYRNPGGAYNVVTKQAIWFLAGLFLLILMAGLKIKTVTSYMPFIYAVNIILLLVVDLLGKTSLGAQRWIPIGSFNFQPSELGKLLIIITLATYLAEKRDKPYGFKDFALACLHVGIPLLLIFKQPDLGTSLVFIAILLGCLVFARFNAQYILYIIVGCIIAGFSAIKFGILSDYQMKRLLVFIDPSQDPLGSGYNILQSQITIGSGGLIGKGFARGTQTALNFLPHHETDFIFSVVGEEWGFIGAVFILLLFLALLFKGIHIGKSSRDKFGQIAAGGIVAMLFFQILVNVGMTIGVMPITGIPLPFLSYGGSSIITNLMAVGLLLNISSRR